MSTPFISEIKIVGFGFAPKGWAFSNGQILPINQNQALFSLLGTTYGGDGQQTFALPNLQGCVPMHSGNNYILGQAGGEEDHTLTQQEIPAHNHSLAASTAAATTSNPTAAYLAAADTEVGNVYAQGPANTQFSPSAVGQQTSGGQPHENMQPYLVLNFVIALQGIYPSRN